MGFNQAVIMGNLTKDPELRYTQSKQPVAGMNVAVNRKYKAGNGEMKEQVSYLPVVVWGPTAEACERYLRKGSPVLIAGRIETRSYEDKQGQKRYVTEIIATDVKFLYSKSDAQQGQSPQPQQSYGKQPPSNYGGGNAKSYRDDSFPMDISDLGGPIGAPEENSDVPF